VSETNGPRTTRKPPVGEAWELPPRPVKPDWGQVAATLRKHPHDWLRVYSHGLETWANALMRGRIKALHPDLGFEFRTTDNVRSSPRTCSLYVRFNPDKVDALSELFAGSE
jgi:hypothetical protein